MNASDLPTVNAVLNGISAILLFYGYFAIKRGDKTTHKKFMVSALISSALFLISYLTYHYYAGSVPYPHHDWTRTLYFIILIPHVILAGLMGPFIIIAVRYAIREEFEKHRRLVRFVWPVWIFVSITGVMIYLMLYQL